MSQITKRALAMSLKTLLKRTTLDKITVKAIVDLCGVKRQTFYYHFQDIYSLLDWIFITEAEIIIAENKTLDTWQQGFLAVFEYLLENKVMILNTFRSIGRDFLDQYLYKALFDVILAAIEKEANGLNVSENDKKFIADFYKFAFVGLALEWIRTGMKETPKDIVDQISKLIDGNIKKDLLKF